MDVAGCPRRGCTLTLFVLLLFIVFVQPLVGQTLKQFKELSEQSRWADIARLAEQSHDRSPDVDYYYGIALAQLGRWEQARSVLEQGRALQPSDKRFPIELAGIAFKQKKYALAAEHLRQGLAIDPADTYANDFLASVYFLQGNIEAALKYWNRVDKPRTASIREEPRLRTDPILLDHAFAFAPASTLQVSQWKLTQQRIENLGVFPAYHFDFVATHNETFDVIFRAQERNGFGSNKVQAIVGVLRGLPYQEITPEYFNIHREAINLTSLVRWDPQKRRVTCNLSGPLHRDPRWRYELGADLRNENWRIVPSFAGPASVLAALNLRREGVSAAVSDIPGSQWRWSTGVELSHRDYRSVSAGSTLTHALLSQGWQLKSSTGLNRELLRWPEHRLALETGGSVQVGRLWSSLAYSFAKLQGTVSGHWYPQAMGDDYEVRASIRAGKTFGTIPFDELFMLGAERDNDLWLRGHIGTRDGKKGSAPLGRNYFLANWEIDKNIYENGLVSFKLGPFLDTGRITDASPGLGSRNWLWDVGAQARIYALGVGVGVSYGKDLRTGNNALYTTVFRHGKGGSSGYNASP